MNVIIFLYKTFEWFFCLIFENVNFIFIYIIFISQYYLY